MAPPISQVGVVRSVARVGPLQIIPTHYNPSRGITGLIACYAGDTLCVIRIPFPDGLVLDPSGDPDRNASGWQLTFFGVGASC